MESRLRARLDTWTQALAIKIILLAAVFLVVPIIFYRLFQIADAQQRLAALGPGEGND